jgi:hypothetical protein
VKIANIFEREPKTNELIHGKIDFLYLDERYDT